MSKVTREQIQAVADKIAKEFQPEKIILFGSYAWGTPTEDSDVDMCVIKETKDARKYAREVRGALDTDFPVDILAYSPKDFYDKIHDDRNLFLEDIAVNGIPLYVGY